MININFEKFSEFYSIKIEPLLVDLEEERKRVKKEFLIKRILFLMVFPAQILVFAGLFTIRSFLSDLATLFLGVILPMVVPFFTILWAIYKEKEAKEKQRKYICKLKMNIYTRLFNLLGLNYNLSASSEFNNYKKSVVKHIPAKKEISYSMSFEDCISGIFKDIPFELADAVILEKGYYYDKELQINRQCRKDFLSGLLMLAVKLNKSIKTETVIKSDNFNIFKINKRIVKLEDNEFNKKFKVLADNEVEARYILTPSFMERLKNFHKKRRDKTIIFFDSSCSELKNMFILTNTGKDNFEIPFSKSILNEKYYYNLLKELVDILEIADALKLEQNIGL